MKFIMGTWLEIFLGLIVLKFSNSSPLLKFYAFISLTFA
jgi:hypothetical protein